MSSLPASIKRIGSKITEKRWRHRFPHYKSMGAFCCYGNQSFHPICPKTLCSFSPTPVVLHIKFDQGWPTGFRDIQVWKCGWRRTDDDGRWTIGILKAHLVSLWLRWSKKQTWKKKAKINLNILIFFPTIYLAILKVYTRFEDFGSHRSWVRDLPPPCCVLEQDTLLPESTG